MYDLSGMMHGIGVFQDVGVWVSYFAAIECIMIPLHNHCACSNSDDGICGNVKRAWCRIRPHDWKWERRIMVKHRRRSEGDEAGESTVEK